MTEGVSRYPRDMRPGAVGERERNKFLVWKETFESVQPTNYAGGVKFVETLEHIPFEENAAESCQYFIKLMRKLEGIERLFPRTEDKETGEGQSLQDYFYFEQMLEEYDPEQAVMAVGLDRMWKFLDKKRTGEIGENTKKAMSILLKNILGRSIRIYNQKAEEQAAAIGEDLFYKK